VTNYLSFIRRKVKGAAHYSAGELAMVPVALLLLGLARLAILLVPFKHYSRLLGAKQSGAPLPAALENAQSAKARSIGRTVRATAAITPWNAVCLPQAIAAAALLRMARVPYAVYFGLAKDGYDPRKDPMRAHAWLQAGERIVTGGPLDPEYHVVACFMLVRKA